MCNTMKMEDQANQKRMQSVFAPLRAALEGL
jgi:hypothetical protein